jgi:hypothetical protein
MNIPDHSTIRESGFSAAGSFNHGVLGSIPRSHLSLAFQASFRSQARRAGRHADCGHTVAAGPSSRRILRETRTGARRATAATCATVAGPRRHPGVAARRCVPFVLRVKSSAFNSRQIVAKAADVRSAARNSANVASGCAVTKALQVIDLAFQHPSTELRLLARGDRAGLASPLFEGIDPRAIDVIPSRQVLRGQVKSALESRLPLLVARRLSRA